MELLASFLALFSDPSIMSRTQINMQMCSATQKFPHLLFGEGFFGYKTAQVGIRWKIGDGKSVRFWKD